MQICILMQKQCENTCITKGKPTDASRKTAGSTARESLKNGG